MVYFIESLISWSVDFVILFHIFNTDFYNDSWCDSNNFKISPAPADAVPKLAPILLFKDVYSLKQSLLSFLCNSLGNPKLNSVETDSIHLSGHEYVCAITHMTLYLHSTNIRYAYMSSFNA